MKTELKERFLVLWKKYFGKAELPIVFYYTDSDGGAERAEKPKGRSCIICELAKVRNGRSLLYNADSLVCGGAKRYLGYTNKIRSGFEYFLSSGKDQIEGERYIRTPEMVKEIMKNQKTLPIAGKNIVFKRWDNLSENDDPDVVGLFRHNQMYYQDYSLLQTLSNQNQTEQLPLSVRVAEQLSIFLIWKAYRKDKEQL